jgi:hypothetical protein
LLHHKTDPRASGQSNERDEIENPKHDFLPNDAARPRMRKQLASTYSFKVAPFPITATTNTIKITGTFNNFYDNAGCNLTIEGVFMPRIF